LLADQSARYAPTEWARTAIALYRQHKADRIVAEVNNGGDMVESTIRMIDPNVSYSAVRASRDLDGTAWGLRLTLFIELKLRGPRWGKH
jgi:phage terminase large subunit-like protein